MRIIIDDEFDGELENEYKSIDDDSNIGNGKLSNSSGAIIDVEATDIEGEQTTNDDSFNENIDITITSEKDKKEVKSYSTDNGFSLELQGATFIDYNEAVNSNSNYKNEKIVIDENSDYNNKKIEAGYDNEKIKTNNNNEYNNEKTTTGYDGYYNNEEIETSDNNEYNNKIATGYDGYYNNEEIETSDNNEYNNKKIATGYNSYYNNEKIETDDKDEYNNEKITTGYNSDYINKKIGIEIVDDSDDDYINQKVATDYNIKENVLETERFEETYINNSNYTKIRNKEKSKVGKITVISKLGDIRGSSISDAKINLYALNGLSPKMISSKFTDKDGVVIFDNLAEGSYRVIEIVNRKYFEKPTYIQWNEVTINDELREESIIVINKVKRH